MGGGASKSHNIDEEQECHLSQQKQQKQLVQKHHHQNQQKPKETPAEEKCGERDVKFYAPTDHTLPSRQTEVLVGNNGDEDGVGSYSPRDEEDLERYSSHEDGDDEVDEEEDDEEAMQLRMLFAQSAMSMDMDNEDLIFNLMYFGGDSSSANFASMMSNAAEETVAAHSAGNTPYKLTPATEVALQKLKIMTVTESLISNLNLQECSICQEEIETEQSIAEMPGCGHCFHNECVLKWFTLQSWCPVCRTKILSDDDESCDCDCGGDESLPLSTNKVNNTSPLPVDDNPRGVKSNLDSLFTQVADDVRKEGV